MRAPLKLSTWRSRHEPATDRERLAVLEAALDNQLDRALAANGVMRQFLQDRDLMADFHTWQLMHWRGERRAG